MSSAVLAILAGGFSRRYQESNVQWQDKALTKFHGIPLLVNLIRRASRHYDTVSISVNSNKRKEDYLKIIRKFEPSLKPKFVVDKDNTEIKGVLLGISSIITEYKEKEIQIIPTDFPYIDFNILQEMSAERGGVGILHYTNGMIEPLLTYYGFSRYFPEQFQRLSLSRADVFIRISSHLKLYNIDQLLEENQISSNVFSNLNIQSASNSERDTHQKNNSIIMPAPKEIKRFDLNDLNHKHDYSDYYDFISNIIEKNQFYAAFLWSRFCFQRNIISSEEYKNLGKLSLESESQLWLDEDLLFLALHAFQDLIKYFPEEKNETITNEISLLRKKMGIEPRKVK